MMAALISGQRDPKVLAAMAPGRMRAKTTVLQEAFTGYFTNHHAFLPADVSLRTVRAGQVM
jgi:transposase